MRFTKIDKTYYLTGEDFIDFLEKETRKSIPIHYFDEKGFILKNTFRPQIDYLKVVDKILEVK